MSRAQTTAAPPGAAPGVATDEPRTADTGLPYAEVDILGRGEDS